MKLRIYVFIVAVSSLFVNLPLGAEDLEQPVPIETFLQQLIAAVGGVPAAGVLGGSVIVTQVVMAFFRTSLAGFAGKWRLVIVYGLSLVACTVGLVATGQSWVQALLDANVLAAAQVFGHQILKQFTEKKV